MLVPPDELLFQRRHPSDDVKTSATYKPTFRETTRATYKPTFMEMRTYQSPSFVDFAQLDVNGEPNKANASSDDVLTSKASVSDVFSIEERRRQTTVRVALEEDGTNIVKEDDALTSSDATLTRSTASTLPTSVMPASTEAGTPALTLTTSSTISLSGYFLALFIFLLCRCS